MMPSSPRRVHISLQRACPACMDIRCADPAECLYFLTSRPWGDCITCDGTGWAGEETPLGIFCDYCVGSGLNEYAPGAIVPEQISDRAKERHAAYVARLTELVSSASSASAVVAA